MGQIASQMFVWVMVAYPPRFTGDQLMGQITPSSRIDFVDQIRDLYNSVDQIRDLYKFLQIYPTQHASGNLSQKFMIVRQNCYEKTKRFVP
jgi:hypothetical protein